MFKEESTSDAVAVIDPPDAAATQEALPAVAESPVDRLPVGEGRRRRGRPRKHRPELAQHAPSSPPASEPAAEVESPEPATRTESELPATVKPKKEPTPARASYINRRRR